MGDCINVPIRPIKFRFGKLHQISLENLTETQLDTINIFIRQLTGVRTGSIRTRSDPGFEIGPNWQLSGSGIPAAKFSIVFRTVFFVDKFLFEYFFRQKCFSSKMFFIKNGFHQTFYVKNVCHLISVCRKCSKIVCIKVKLLTYYAHFPRKKFSFHSANF